MIAMMAVGARRSPGTHIAWRGFLIGVMALLGLATAHAQNTRVLRVDDASPRHALVIGIDDYRTIDKLEKAGNDARAVGAKLERIGFQTTLLIDANRRQINTAVNDFVERIAGGGEGVLFFAGHGVQINNQNYLLPADIESPRGEADIDDQAISLQGIQDKIARAHPRFTLLIVDACRDNPLPRRAGRALGATRGLALAGSAEGQMILFSAGANQQALDKLYDDDPDPNGLFTRELLPWLDQPGVSVRQAMQEVRRAVHARAKKHHHNQFPAMYDQVLGEYYFVPKPAHFLPLDVTPPAPVPASVPAPRPPPVVLTPVAPATEAPTGPVPTAAMTTAARRPVLAHAGIGVPTYRAFWSGENRAGYSRRIDDALARLGAEGLGMAAHALHLDAAAFDTLWNEPADAPRARALCADTPTPARLLLARVETPPVHFTDIESAYWPELKLRLIDCADFNIRRHAKILAPRNGEAWPFAAEFHEEVAAFLRRERDATQQGVTP